MDADGPRTPSIEEVPEMLRRAGGNWGRVEATLDLEIARGRPSPFMTQVRLSLTSTGYRRLRMVESSFDPATPLELTPGDVDVSGCHLAPFTCDEHRMVIDTEMVARWFEGPISMIEQCDDVDLVQLTRVADRSAVVVACRPRPPADNVTTHLGAQHRLSVDMETGCVLAVSCQRGAGLVWHMRVATIVFDPPASERYGHLARGDSGKRLVVSLDEAQEIAGFAIVTLDPMPTGFSVATTVEIMPSQTLVEVRFSNASTGQWISIVEAAGAHLSLPGHTQWEPLTVNGKSFEICDVDDGAWGRALVSSTSVWARTNMDRAELGTLMPHLTTRTRSPGDDDGP